MSRKGRDGKKTLRKVLKGLSSNAPMTPAQEAEAKRREAQLEKDRKAIARDVKRAEAIERKRREDAEKAARMRTEYEQFKRDQENKRQK